MNKLLLVNQRGYRADFSWLPNLEKILKKKIKLNKTVSIALLANQEIKELNKVYRHKNKITDVLSFNLDTKDILGEVLICYQQAKIQAKANNHSPKRELQTLTIHGLLHLSGYDHERSLAEQKKQEKLEQEILKILNK